MTASTVSIASFRPSPLVRRAVRDGLVLAGLGFAGYLFLVVAPRAGTFGFDAYAYWSVNMADPYTVPAGTFGAFTYSPVIARLFSVFGQLSWPTFLWLWTAVLVATVIWLGWRQALVVLAFPPVALELYHGNVHLLMAAAIALGFRYPAAWSFLLLTKVTPGIGLVWFAVRREWRPLAIALGFTGVPGRRLAGRRPTAVGRLARREPVQDGERVAAQPVLDRDPAGDPTARGRPGRGLGRANRSAVDGAGGRHARPADPVAERPGGARGALADRPAATRARAADRPRDQVGAERRSLGSLTLRIPFPSSASEANPPSRRPSQATTGMNSGGMSSRL